MWFFASDLHGRMDRYEKLLAAAERERPATILLGGDLLPPFGLADGDFIADTLAPAVAGLRSRLGAAFPKVLVILGNDDARAEEAGIVEGAAAGLWEYVHGARTTCDGVTVFGYACVPPTPFQLKDWERYDVSRYVDPGCVSPEEGRRTMPVAAHETRHATISDDLDRITGDVAVDGSIWLFHAPPYDSALDRAALDGVMVDHAPLDVHVGSIAIRRFIEARQPLVSLHGHVHESARLTGSWRQQIGATWCFSGAHDGHELALVRFDPRNPAAATRELL